MIARVLALLPMLKVKAPLARIELDSDTSGAVLDFVVAVLVTVLLILPSCPFCLVVVSDAVVPVGSLPDCDPAEELWTAPEIRVFFTGVPLKVIFANGLVDDDAAAFKLGDDDDRLGVADCDAVGEGLLPSSLKLDRVFDPNRRKTFIGRLASSSTDAILNVPIWVPESWSSWS